MNYQPIIIIGAARSGTNVLRDTLTSASGWSTWPCDEINLIWRHGNIDKTDDVFTAEDARPEVVTFIRKAFDREHRRSDAFYVVEKTCANSMRVPFIKEAIPEARYIYIVRDGRDAALSAAKRWTASVEPAYLLRKLRFAPVSDLAHYGTRFVRNRLHQMRSQEKRQSSWGPRFPGIDDWVKDRPLLDVCAMQWAQSVEASDSAFESIPAESVRQIKYEDFVTRPRDVIQDIGDWLGEPLLEQIPDRAFANIRAGSAGGWRKAGSAFSELAKTSMQRSLVRHGYEAG